MITSRRWWARIAEAATRNGAQAAVPLIAACSTSPTSVAWTAAALGTALAALTSVLRAMAGVTISPEAPTWVQVTDRAGAAAAGTAIALVGVDGAGLASVGWVHACGAVCAAAMLAAAAWWAAPPARTPR